MKKELSLKVIGRIENDLPTKFGAPRQSGLAPDLTARIVFEKEYRSPDAFKGIGDFSHLWLLWIFSENDHEAAGLTVRPPRLGGNKRVGVFATRSPYRPNPVGLSCVKLEKVEYDEKLGTVLTVSGADMINGTPIVDIKPYLSYTDAHPDARDSFAAEGLLHKLKVEMPKELEARFSKDSLKALTEILEQDPRPSYQDDPERVYGFAYCEKEVRFRVSEDVLYVVAVE